MHKLVAVLLLSVITYSHQVTLDEVRTSLREAVAPHKPSCLDETKVNPDLIENVLMKLDFNEDDALKCYFDCVMTKASAVKDNSELEVSFVNKIMGDAPASLSESVIANCKGVDGGSKCDKYYGMFKCAFTQIAQNLK